VPLLRATGTGAIALDVTDASPARWESLAVTLEEGTQVYAGCLPADGTGTAQGGARLVLGAFERLGLDAALLDLVTVTPACGLAGLTPAGAQDVHRRLLETAREIIDRGGA
jgi:hypothetical protein